jgi:hypothetical protein
MRPMQSRMRSWLLLRFRLEDWQLQGSHGRNIHKEVVSYLRSCGMDVLDVREEGLQGNADEDLLIRAVAENRLVPGLKVEDWST